MEFASTAYEWMLISGSTAQYKGTGTLNGKTGYSFTLTVIDGTTDKFRIIILDKSTGLSLYDNQRGKSDTGSDWDAITKGSINIV